MCPLVEGSEKIEAKAATEELERLRSEELQGLRLGLLHGQMPSADKEAAMAAFRAGKVDVLVATTVIEVGVDVANATVMVVEDAERFGLLATPSAARSRRQRRRRVGVLSARRSGHARRARRAWRRWWSRPTVSCSPSATSRFVARARCSVNARQGGPTSSSGGSRGTRPIVIEARTVAERVLDGDPDLSGHPQLREEVEDLLGEAVEFLFKS